MIKKLALASALMCALVAPAAHAESSAAKKELISKLLTLQQPHLTHPQPSQHLETQHLPALQQQPLQHLQHSHGLQVHFSHLQQHAAFGQHLPALQQSPA